MSHPPYRNVRCRACGTVCPVPGGTVCQVPSGASPELCGTCFNKFVANLPTTIRQRSELCSECNLSCRTAEDDPGTACPVCTDKHCFMPAIAPQELDEIAAKGVTVQTIDVDDWRPLARCGRCAALYRQHEELQNWCYECRKVLYPEPVKRQGMGVGMPQAMYLEEFGSQVWAAFGNNPYLVGSALHGKDWRDIDVRLILSDEEYEELGLGHPDQCHQNGKWVSLCMAYSALGKHLTGLPIDFQIQQQTAANKAYDGPRSALGLVALRIRKQ